MRPPSWFQLLSCWFGIHNWGPKVRMRIKHESAPKDPNKWAHMCDANRKFCIACGKNGPLTETCSGVVAPIFGDQAKSAKNFGGFMSDYV